MLLSVSPLKTEGLHPAKCENSWENQGGCFSQLLITSAQSWCYICQQETAPGRILSGELVHEDIPRQRSRRAVCWTASQHWSFTHQTQLLLLFWCSWSFWPLGFVRDISCLLGHTAKMSFFVSISLVTVDIPMAANSSWRHDWGADTHRLWEQPALGLASQWMGEALSQEHGNLYWLFREVKSYSKLKLLNNKKKSFHLISRRLFYFCRFLSHYLSFTLLFFSVASFITFCPLREVDNLKSLC